MAILDPCAERHKDILVYWDYSKGMAHHTSHHKSTYCQVFPCFASPLLVTMSSL